jgi:large subunit ribosomal protein L18
MSSSIRPKTNERQVIRLLKKARIKKKLSTSWARIPRLVIYRSNTTLYAQLVDDKSSRTLVQAHTGEAEFKSLKSKKNLEAAKALGSSLGKRAIEKKIENVFFDRNGYIYHGRIKAVAESAREAGLKF